jgi:hypothetical protein
MAKKKEVIAVPCIRCGGNPRNHSVVCEHVEPWKGDEEDNIDFDCYQIVKCLGCETIRFRQSSRCCGGVGIRAGEWQEYDIHIYPDLASGGLPPEDRKHLPKDVAKMYLETIHCFNAGAHTLAGGGLRAIVEAICKHERASGKNLQAKISGLVTKGYMAQMQADLLHEERYIGNDALHEMKTPTRQDLEDGLKIVEGLMNTIYVLPERAARLKSSRAAGKSASKGGSGSKKS